MSDTLGDAFDEVFQKQWANSKKDHMASLGIVGSVPYDKPIHTIVTGSQIDTPAFKSWFGVSTRASLIFAPRMMIQNPTTTTRPLAVHITGVFFLLILV